MKILREIAGEVFRMFAGEKWLTLGILAIVAAAAAALNFAGLNPLVGGIVLLVGCLGLLVESVCRGARAGGSYARAHASSGAEG
jgi:hypothetical protein